MVIIPSLKKIFIHIPKTGGASLTAAIQEALPDAIADGGEIHGHQIAEFITPSFPGWETFTVVRNPWDLIESYYRWIAQQKANHYKNCSEKVRCFVEDLMHSRPVWRIVTENRAWRPPGMFATYCEEDTKPFMYSETMFSDVSEYLGVELPYKRINTTEVPHIVWSQDLIDAIGERCTDDVRRFGYTPPKAGEA